MKQRWPLTFEAADPESDGPPLTVLTQAAQGRLIVGQEVPQPVPAEDDLQARHEARGNLDDPDRKNAGPSSPIRLPRRSC